MRRSMGMLKMLLFCAGGVVLAVVAVALGFSAAAPFLLFGGCALMMVMMMRGMGDGGHGGVGHDTDDKSA